MLGIGHDPRDITAQCSGDMRPAEMQQTRLRHIAFQNCVQCVNIPLSRDRLQTNFARLFSRAPPDAIGLTSNRATSGPISPHTVLRREDQNIEGCEINLDGMQHDLHHRRHDRLDLIAQSLHQQISQFMGLRIGTGQNHPHQASLVIVRHITGCYLPDMTRATDSDPITILGIESSCDDTAAAVVRHRVGETPEILSSEVFGQTELHADFGGVVPEIAARAHAEKLDHMVEAALAAADTDLHGINAIAVTAGPGLIGGVLSGVMCAKGLAAARGLPLIGVNHLAGHALTPRLTDGLAFPYLMLLVSGGHCQFLIANSATGFKRLGGTIDDAPGEAFDKVAKLIGLPQPGGPAIEAAAKTGDPKRFKLPRPLLERADCDMSFSGLKTAALRERDKLVAQQGGLYRRDQADLSAGFQTAVSDVLTAKTARALDIYLAETPSEPALAVAGGVAANTEIREKLQSLCETRGVRFTAPPLALCTDNAAMIAWVGVERFRLGLLDDMSLAARPRWPLDDRAAPMLGSGKKGAKA